MQADPSSRLVICLFLGFSAIGCSPSPVEQITPHLGRIARMRIVVDRDPASHQEEWLEGVKLVQVVRRDGMDHVLVELTGFEVSPRDGRPIRFPVAVERIVAIEIDEIRVYRRE